MNEKLNMQDLIDLLALKHGMSKNVADNFVKEFFGLIEKALENDKYVKIKGLGTFKLIDVDSRESVNVNTGERFEIQGHTKVSFAPDLSLKEIINKPFSHFETVILNDHTVLEDTPVEGAAEEEDVEILSDEKPVLPVEEKLEEAITPTQDIVEAPAQTAEPPVESIEQPIVEPDIPLEKTEDTQKENIQAETEIPTYTDFASPTQPHAFQIEDTSTMKYFIGIVVFVILLCGGALTFMYYPDILDDVLNGSSTEKTTDEKANIKGTLTDSIAKKDSILVAQKDTVAKVDTVKVKAKAVKVETVVKDSKKTTVTPFIPNSAEYTIDGTQTTYTIQEGETLTRVALHFYGTKALWPYIVKHNPAIIKDPNHVPYGTVIKIPKLVKK